MDAIKKTNEYIRTSNQVIDNLLCVVDAQLSQRPDKDREVVLIRVRGILARAKMGELRDEDTRED